MTFCPSVYNDNITFTSHSKWWTKLDIPKWPKILEEKIDDIEKRKCKKEFFKVWVRTLKRVFHKVGREKNMAWYREGPLHVFNDELHLKPTEAFRYLLLYRVCTWELRRTLVLKKRNSKNSAKDSAANCTFSFVRPPTAVLLCRIKSRKRMGFQNSLNSRGKSP